MSKAELLADVIKENVNTQTETDVNIPKRGADSEARRSYIESVEVKTKVNGLPYGLHTEETDEPSGRDKRLTKRQMHFASNVIDGMTPYTHSNVAYVGLAELGRLIKRGFNSVR